MSILTIPNTFTPGEEAFSAQVNANFSAVATAVNNIYPLQIIPTTLTQATFGSSLAYTFPSAVYTDGTSGLIPTGIHGGLSTLEFIIESHGGAGGVGMLFDVPTGNGYQWAVNGGATKFMQLSGTGGLTLVNTSGTGTTQLALNMTASQSVPGLLINGAASITGNLLQVDLTSGGVHALLVDSTGRTIVTGLSTISIPAPGGGGALAAGDLVFQRSVSTGRLYAGGATTAGFIDFNIINANAYTFGNNTTFAPIFAGAYTNSSDASLKSNIAAIASGTAEIMALKPSSFTITATGVNGLGFIAQDVQQVLPTLVSTDMNGTMGVCYDGIIPVLVKAFQEMQTSLRAAGVAGF